MSGPGSRAWRAEAMGARRRPMRWVAVLVTAACAAIPPLSSDVLGQVLNLASGHAGDGRGASNGWTLWAVGMQAGAVIAALWLAVEAGAAVAGDRGLRAVLLQPVRRAEVLVAKAGRLLVRAAVLLLAAAASAGAAAASRADFAAVSEPGVAGTVSSAELAMTALAALVLGWLALCATAMIGLALSTWIESAAAAVSAAAMVTAPALVVAYLVPGLRPWLWSTHAASPFGALRDRAGLHTDWDRWSAVPAVAPPWAWAVVTPVVTGGLALLAAAVRFGRRDFRQ